MIPQESYLSERAQIDLTHKFHAERRRKKIFNGTVQADDGSAHRVFAGPLGKRYFRALRVRQMRSPHPAWLETRWIKRARNLVEEGRSV
jgi:hypothetical protein